MEILFYDEKRYCKWRRFKVNLDFYWSHQNVKAKQFTVKSITNIITTCGINQNQFFIRSIVMGFSGPLVKRLIVHWIKRKVSRRKFLWIQWKSWFLICDYLQRNQMMIQNWKWWRSLELWSIFVGEKILCFKINIFKGFHWNNLKATYINYYIKKYEKANLS